MLLVAGATSLSVPSWGVTVTPGGLFINECPNCEYVLSFNLEEDRCLGMVFKEH